MMKTRWVDKLYTLIIYCECKMLLVNTYKQLEFFIIFKFYKIFVTEPP
jgi:hypothetical protein